MNELQKLKEALADCGNNGLYGHKGKQAFTEYLTLKTKQKTLICQTMDCVELLEARKLNNREQLEALKALSIACIASEQVGEHIHRLEAQYKGFIEPEYITYLTIKRNIESVEAEQMKE